MADRLKVTELDFDTIKNNLKSFLKQQNEFTDYDFEGSGLSVLLDILAYNTHYNAYYLNMVANESFLDTALLRNSVVSHAKSLGYTPYSTKSPVTSINLEVFSFNNNTGTLTLPVGYNFLSNQIDGKSYSFTTLQEHVSTKSNGSYLFENLRLYEGRLLNYRFSYDEQTNPKQTFTLPDGGIDTDTLKVLVYPSASSTEFSIYQKVSNVVDVTGTSEVYFLQESRTDNYQIYFGNNFVGKKLPPGATIVVSYLVTNGTLANKANNFIATSILSDNLSEPLSNFVITPVSEAAGGSEKESVDSIRYSAVNQYTSQNRLITYNDYESFILSNYPNLNSISVWGGEDETPPVYGKVFISLKPKNNYFISETEKQRIIDDIIKPRSAISTDVIIRDPEFLYVKIISQINYDQKKTILSDENLKNLVRSTTLNYFDLYINKFNSTFALSKLHEEIDNTDVSIVGIQSQLKLEKRFVPLLNVPATYNINYNTSLFRGSTLNKITSTEFDIFDNFGERRKSVIEEVPESFTGLTSVMVENPGSGYSSTPTITITGDGSGATATAKVVNGRIESINITNRGVNYTRAFVRVIGGNGFGATATAILDNRFGTLRTVYFDENAERQVVNSNIGTINYDTGEIILNNLNMLAVYSQDGTMRITAQSEKEIISSSKNSMIVIDSTDTTSLIVTTVKV
jgi:hypothetical protein